MTDPIDPAALELERLWLGVTSADCEPGELARAFMAYAQALVEKEREAWLAQINQLEDPSWTEEARTAYDLLRQWDRARGGGEGV